METYLIGISQVFVIIAVFVMHMQQRDDIKDWISLQIKIEKWLNNRDDYYKDLINKFGKRAEKELRGKSNEVLMKAKIAEKFADRAFTMSSTANLAIMALQKTLPVPRPMTKEQKTRNQLAKNQIDELFSKGGFDLWRPFLSDEELEILDQAEENVQKMEMNNSA